MKQSKYVIKFQIQFGNENIHLWFKSSIELPNYRIIEANMLLKHMRTLSYIKDPTMKLITEEDIPQIQ